MESLKEQAKEVKSQVKIKIDESGGSITQSHCTIALSNLIQAVMTKEKFKQDIHLQPLVETIGFINSLRDLIDDDIIDEMIPGFTDMPYPTQLQSFVIYMYLRVLFLNLNQLPNSNDSETITEGNNLMEDNEEAIAYLFG